VHWNVPHSSSPRFTGREDVLQQMEQALFLETNLDHEALPPRRAFVLHGLGGSGKTQICLRFCEKHRERLVRIIPVNIVSCQESVRGCGGRTQFHNCKDVAVLCFIPLRSKLFRATPPKRHTTPDSNTQDAAPITQMGIRVARNVLLGVVWVNSSGITLI
jgi:hypothetical protein